MDNTIHLTPDVKAKELIYKFTTHTQLFNESRGWYSDVNAAKNCAIISVDELISSYSAYTGMHDQDFFDSELKYWQQVRTAIQNLK